MTRIADIAAQINTARAARRVIAAQFAAGTGTALDRARFVEHGRRINTLQLERDALLHPAI